MNINEAILQAIEQLWSEFPQLVGDGWPQLAEQLTPLLEEARRDPTNATILCAQMMSHFKQHKSAYSRLVEMISQQQQDEMKLRQMPSLSRNSKSASSRDIEQARRPVTRYTDIQLPTSVQVKQRFAVLAGLTITPSRYSVALSPVSVISSQRVRVVLAPGAGLEMLSERMHELRVETDRDSDPAVFYLRALMPGHYALGIEYWLEGQLVASSSHTIAAVDEAVTETPSQPAGQALTLGLPAPAHPDLVLRITTKDNRLNYDLHFADLRFVSVPGAPLRSDPEVFRYNLIQRIEQLARDVPGTNIQAALEREGQNLYKELFPAELRREYRNFCHTIKNLQIISDEPWIPWELIKPYDDAGSELLDHDFLCMQFDLARWFTPAPSADHIHIESVATIAPSDSGLPAAQKERAGMADLAQKRRLTDHTPLLPNRDAVFEKLLKGENPISLWHFACHGNFKNDQPKQSPLILQQSEILTPHDMVGKAETRIKNDRPLMVLNACRVGQNGLALTGMGGWAKTLIEECGAGALLAPLWSISDTPAYEFVFTFYQATLKQPDCTISQAVRTARQLIRTRWPHDPTWLAYSLYAHCNARLVWNGEQK